MKKSTKIILGIAALIIVFVIVAFTPPSVETHRDSRMMIPSSKEVVWEVIADVGNYHRYATGLDNVTIVSGSGEGMVRSCSDEQGAWLETCTAWNEGNSYSFNVDPGTGFPYPFKMMQGTWSVQSIDENLSEIQIEFNYQFPYRWMKWMFSKATHEAFDEGDKTLLDNWENAVMLSDVDLNKVLNKHFEKSGVEKLKMLETQIWKGKSNDTQFVLYQKRPGKARLDAKKDTIEFSQIYDGQSSWMIAPWLGNRPAKTTYPDNRAIKTYSEFDSPIYYAFNHNHDMAYEGFDYVDHLPAYKVVVDYPNKDFIEYYIHAESGLIVKQVDYFKSQKGEQVNMAINYTDYQEIDGIQIPFSMEQSFSYEEGSNKIEITSVEFDKSVDTSIFSL